MLPTVLLCLGLSFILTTMLSQLFPDGRFPLFTVLVTTLLGAAGAWVGNLYLSDALFTGPLVGAGITSGLLLMLLHRTGFFVSEPWPVEQKEESVEEVIE